jgi:hypothetical protein
MVITYWVVGVVVLNILGSWMLGMVYGRALVLDLRLELRLASDCSEWGWVLLE